MVGRHSFKSGQRARVRIDGPERLAPSRVSWGVTGILLSPAGSQPRGIEAEPPGVYFVELDNGTVEPIHVDWLEPVENGTESRRYCSVCGHGPESHVMRVCMRCGENEQSRIRFDWAPAHDFTLALQQEEQT